MARPSPRFVRSLALVVGVAATLIASTAARAAGTWDVIVPSLMNTTLCNGCGVTLGGAALLVNTGAAPLSAADLATATFTVQSSRSDVSFQYFLLNEQIIAPIAAAEAVGKVHFIDDGVFTPNDIFLDSVASWETFRNTDPVWLIGFGISRDSGDYEGPVVFDVTMLMGGRIALFTINADFHLGNPHIVFVEAQRVHSLPGATATRTTTWGAIKKLYHDR